MQNPAEKFRELYPYVTEEDLELLLSVSELREFKAREKVVQLGDDSYNNYMVLQGVLRTYTLGRNGEEKTLFLAGEGMNTGSMDNLLFKRPAQEEIMAVVDTWAVVTDLQKLEELSLKNIGLMRLHRDAYKLNLKEAIERLTFYTKLQPKDRYDELLKKHPDLIKHVPQKYLASYLGMTPVSLSRIRGRYARSKK